MSYRSFRLSSPTWRVLARLLSIALVLAAMLIGWPHQADALDPAAWTVENSDASSGIEWMGVGYGGGRWVAVGGYGAEISTSTGGDWTHTQFTGGVTLYMPAYGNGTWVVVGGVGLIYSGTGAPSTTAWPQRASHTTEYLSDVAYGAGKFVAVGGDDLTSVGGPSHGLVVTSDDGITWSAPNIVTNAPFYGVTWTGTQFVAVGVQGRLYTSDNGLAWTAQDSKTTVDLFGVSYGNNTLVAVGNSGTVVRSTDNGITWTVGSAGTAEALYSVAYGGAKFVAVGANRVIRSSTNQGVTWGAESVPASVPAAVDDGTGIPLGLWRIVAADRKFVIVGGSDLILSQPTQAPTTTTVSVDPSPSVYGQSVTLTVAVSTGDPSLVPAGDVTFKDGGTAIGTGTLDSKGQATLTKTNLSVGNHTFTATYPGSSTFLSSASDTVAHAVDPADTTTWVAATVNPAVFGQSVTFTAMVEPVAPGTGTPTGAVTFRDGGTLLETKTLSGGRATYTPTALSVGAHNITVEYDGDTHFSASTGSLSATVNKANTSTTLTPTQNPVVLGQSVTFTATVSAAAPGAGKPTGTVTFREGETVLSTGTLNESRQATYTTKDLTVGTHSITAGYGGDDNFVESVSSTLTQTVNTAPTTTNVTTDAASTVYGQSVTITAKVSAEDSVLGTPKGDVTFKDGTTNLSTVTLDGSGQATLTTSALSIATHAITVAYGGDTHFSASSGSVSLAVDKATTRTTVTSDVSTTVYGQAVTFTATVSGVSYTDATPAGTVTWKDGSTTLGTVTLNGSGQATYTTSTRSVGTHTITASYGSNSTFATSSSESLTHTVNQAATTTEISADHQPSLFGQSVTYTATVTAVAPGAGLPTGTVTFKDGSTELGTGTLNGSGQATYTTTALSVGAHNLTATYAGDTRFVASNSAALAQTVEQAATTTTVSADHHPAVFGQSVTFTASVTAVSPGGGTPTGTVRFSDGGALLGTGTLNGSGLATYTTGALAVGTHEITATYDGDTSFITSTAVALNEQVDQAHTTTTVAADPSPSVFGGTVTFTATVKAVAPGSGTPSGTVTFKDGSTTLGTGTLNGSGQASYPAAGLSVGTHAITAAYDGDTRFTTSAGTTTQTVNLMPTTTTVTAEPNPALFGQSVTFTATVVAADPTVGTPAGTVSFKDGATTLGTGTLNGSGQATYTATALSIATHAVTAVYTGDANFKTSSGSLAQVVNKATTITALEADVNPSVYGQAVTFTATVTGLSYAGSTPTGTVTFKDGGVTLAARTLNGSGQATFTTTAPLAMGAHAITAVYAGDGTFATSTADSLTQTVNLAESATAVSVNHNPSVFGQAVTYTATVTVVSPGAGTPTGTVTFKDGSTELGTGTLSGSGQATYAAASLSVGAHAVTATYEGDTHFGTSTSAPLAQTVGQAETTTTVSADQNPSVFGQSVTFTATVAALSPGVGIPTGTVRFSDGEKELGTGTLNSSGRATYTAKALAVGTHTITAQYDGDTNFTASTAATIDETVTRAATATTLSADKSTTVFGEAVTFTATVKAVAPGSGTPSGTVTFTDGSNPPVTGALNESGQATYTPSTLTVGTHTITATYDGDTNFKAGTASTMTQTINQADTATTLSADKSTTVFGEAVTFTATVKAVAPGAGTPSGTVTFTDGSTPLGTGTLNESGQATYTASALTVGTHAITAAYASDITFKASTANKMTQTVNPAGTATNVSTDPNPAFFGQTVTFTATVKAAKPGSGTPTGTVTFKEGSVLLGTGTLNGSGEATYATAALRAGTHNIMAVYGGDTNFTGSIAILLTQTVNQAAGTMAVNTVSGPFKSTVTLTATLTPAAPDKLILFTVNGDEVGTGTTNETGTATVTYPSTVTVGAHTIGALFAGDADIARTTGDGILNVTQAKGVLSVAEAAGTYKGNVTLQATLSPPAANKPIAFTVGGLDVGTATTNASGVATLSYKIVVPIGTATIGATFAGDPEISDNTATNRLTITQATGVLSVENLEGNPRETINLRATLSPADEGLTITFAVNGADVGTGKTGATGLATYAYTLGPKAATLTVTARFAGNSNIKPANGSGTVEIRDTKPTLDLIDNQSTVEGSPVHLIVAGTDLDGDTLTFSASSLPPGLTIDGKTGEIAGSISGSAAADSPYSAIVTVTDNTPGGPDGDSTSQAFTWTVTEDTAPPTWSAPVTLNVSTIKETSLTLFWAAAADNAAVAGYQIYRDGTAIGTTTAASFAVTGLTANTLYNFEVEAVDPAGNQSAGGPSASVYTALGTPVVTHTARETWLRADDTITLRFPGQPGVTASYSLAYEQSPDGTTYTAHAPLTGSFAADSALSPNYTATITIPTDAGYWRNLVVTVTATDATPATTHATVTLPYRIDTVAPALTGASTDATRPLKGGELFTIAVTGEAGLTAQASITTLDPVTGLPQSDTTVTVSLTEKRAGRYAYTYTVGAAENRNVQVAVSLTDLSGNRSTATVSEPVVLDNLRPVIHAFAVLSPPRLHGGVAYYGIPGMLKVELATESGLTSDGAGLQDVAVTLPGSTLTGLPGGVLHLTETGAGTGVYQGSYLLQFGDKTAGTPAGQVQAVATVTDPAGNTTTATADQLLIVNTTPPQVTSVDHDGLAAKPIDGVIRITAWAEKDLPDVHYSFELSGGVTRTGDLIQVAPGIYEASYTIRATDVTPPLGSTLTVSFATAFGNTVTKTLTRPLHFDTVPPTIGTVTVTPSSGTLLAGETLTVSFSGEPKLRAVGTVDGLFRNLPFNETAPGQYSLTHTVAAGEKATDAAVTLSAWDPAGNGRTASSAVRVTVIAAPPAVNVQVSDTPEGRDGWYTTAPTLTFRVETGATFALKDGESPVALTTGPTPDGGADRYTYLVPDGQHHYVYTASKAGSQTATGTLPPLKVDTTAPGAPVLTALLPPGVTTTRLPAVDLRVSLLPGDGVTGLDLLSGEEPLQQAVVTESSFTLPGVSLIEDLNGGVNRFTVRVYDAAGNVSPLSNPVTVTRDSTPPSFAIQVDQAARTIQVTPSEPLQTGSLLVRAKRDGTELTVLADSPARVGESYRFHWGDTKSGTTLRVTVSGQDAAGNSGTGSWTVTRLNPADGGTVSDSDGQVSARFDGGALTNGQVTIASYSTEDLRHNTFVPPGTQILDAYDFRAALNDGASVAVSYRLTITGTLPAQIGIYNLPVDDPEAVPTLIPAKMTLLSTRAVGDASGTAVNIYTVQVEATLPHFSIWAPFVDQTAPAFTAPLLVNGSPVTGEVINTATATISGKTDGTARTAQALLGGTVIAAQDLGALTQDEKSFSLSVPLGGDGLKLVTIKLLDEFANSQTQDLNLLLDTQPPAVTALKLDGSAYAAGNVYATTATVTHLTGGTDSGARLTVTGPTGPVISDALETFTADLALTANALTTYTVVATDAAGNRSTPVQVLIRSDTEAPVLTLTGLRAITPEQNVTFSYNVSEPVRSMTLAVDGGATLGLTHSTDQSVANISLHFPTDGSYTLTATATDLAGNVTTATQQVAVNTTSPVVTLSAAPNPTKSDTTLTVTATRGGTPLPGDTPMVVRLRGETLALDDPDLHDGRSTLTIPLGKLTEGDNLVSVSLADAGEIGASTDLIITKDTVSPTASDLTLSPTTTNGDVTAQFTLSEPARVLIDYPGAGSSWAETHTWDLAAGSQSRTFTLPVGTNYSLQLTLTDAAGNNNNDEPIPFSERITVDTTAPTVTISGIADRSGSRDVTFGYSVSEPVQGVTLAVNGGATLSRSTATAQQSSDIRLHFPSDGTFTLTVSATDAAGNQGQTSRTITVDSRLPAVTASFSPTLTAAGATLTVRATLNGVAAPDDSTVTVNLGSDAVTLSDPHLHAGMLSRTFSVGELAEGENLATVTVTGTNGLSGSAVTVVTRDTIAPDATGISLSPLQTADTVQFRFTLTESAKLVVEYQNGNGPWAMAYTSGDDFRPAGSQTIEIQLPAPGTYHFRLNMTDHVNHTQTRMAADAVQVIVPDSPQPLVINVTPAATLTAQSTVALNGATTANASITVTRDGEILTTLTAGSDGSFHYVAALTEGSNRFTLTATTGALSATATVNVTRDSAAPVLSVTVEQVNEAAGSAKLAIQTEPAAHVTVNGQAVTLTPDGAVLFSVALAVGQNQFRVTATDAAGNQTSATVSASRGNSTPAEPGEPGEPSAPPVEPGDPGTPPSEPGQGFTDIAGHWAERAILELVASGAVQGYPDGTFAPDATINRAQFMTMLARALGIVPATTNGPAFTDQAEIPDWAEGYVAALAAAGLTKGDAEGTFRPDSKISRAEMAQMMARVLAYRGIGVADAGDPTFVDLDQIPAWALPAVRTAVASGLMTGFPDGSFQAREPITRAQAAVVIGRLLTLPQTGAVRP